MKLSYAQHQANQANAQKSTGPRTEEGKKRSSLNALKHGGTAQTIILPGEDAMHFARFRKSMHLHFAPANALEESLVNTLVQNQWATDRIRAYETSLFAIGHEKFAEAIDTGGDPVIQSALAGAKTAKVEMESLKSLSLCLQRNGRMFESTLKQLLVLQATRKAEEKTKIELAADIFRIHSKAGVPFDVKEYGFDCSTKEIEFFIRRQNAKTRPYIPPAPIVNASSAA